MPSIDDIYLGNPNLKKANTEIEFTQEQILEFMPSTCHSKILEIKKNKWVQGRFVGN